MVQIVCALCWLSVGLFAAAAAAVDICHSKCNLTKTFNGLFVVVAVVVVLDIECKESVCCRANRTQESDAYTKAQLQFRLH